MTFRSPSPSPPAPLPPGEGRIEFTVNLADLQAGPLWIRDLGVYVTRADDDVPFEQYRAQCEAAPRQPIYERVEREPEQTYARAAAEIPELDIAAHPPYGRYVVLSAEANQHKFALRYNGEIFTGKVLAKLNNRSLERLRWPGREIHWRIGAGDPPDFRERNRASRQWCEDGYLPVFHTAWHDRDIAYEQVAMAALVDAPMDGWARPARRRGQRPVNDADRPQHHHLTASLLHLAARLARRAPLDRRAGARPRPRPCPARPILAGHDEGGESTTRRCCAQSFSPLPAPGRGDGGEGGIPANFHRRPILGDLPQRRAVRALAGAG